MDYSEQHSLVGKKLGSYEVKSRLGSGGMGVVYLGFDAALDRHVALKTLAQGYSTNESWLARFHREAKAAARLRHPNIVQVYGVDLDEVPPYIAMEFVEGVSLDALIREKGAFAWQHALTVCMQVAAALECAHEKGVIHRDIKPGNILIDAKGNAHVTDFGVAKLMESNTQLTTSGAMIGTPQYMSPEQFGAGEVGPHSDLFSLGAVTFEMLTGQVPFKADTPAMLVKKITLEAPDSNIEDTALPPAVKQFVTGLLQKEASNRYPTAKAVLQDLRQIQQQQALVHSPAAPQIDLASSMVDDLLAGTRATSAVARNPDRRPSPLLFVVVGVLLMAVVGVMILMAWGPGNQNAQQQVPQLGVSGAPPQPLPESARQGGAQFGPGPENRPPRPNADGLYPPRDGYRPPPGTRPGQPGFRPPPRGGPLGGRQGQNPNQRQGSTQGQGPTQIPRPQAAPVPGNPGG